MLGCALAAAYGPAGTRLWSGWGVLAALAAAIGVAALSGAHVPAAVGALLVATGAHMALTLPRLGDDLARVVAAAKVTPLSFDNVHDRARQFQRTIWWRNARESAAAVFLLAMNAYTLAFTRPDSAAGWAAPVLGVAGLGCMLYALHVKAGSRRVPDGLDGVALLRFHQAEIARQRDVLRAVPYWYLLPLVPTMIAKAHRGLAPGVEPARAPGRGRRLLRHRAPQSVGGAVARQPARRGARARGLRRRLSQRPPPA